MTDFRQLPLESPGLESQPFAAISSSGTQAVQAGDYPLSDSSGSTQSLPESIPVLPRSQFGSTALARGSFSSLDQTTIGKPGLSPARAIQTADLPLSFIRSTVWRDWQFALSVPSTRELGVDPDDVHPAPEEGESEQLHRDGHSRAFPPVQSVAPAGHQQLNHGERRVLL